MNFQDAKQRMVRVTRVHASATEIGRPIGLVRDSPFYTVQREQ